MAEGRQRVEWERASALIATVINVKRDPKKPAVQPETFNPFARRQKPVQLDAAESMQALKDAFVGT